MAKEITTIYIDDSAIRVLKTSGRQPQKWCSASLEPGLVKNGVIMDEDAVAARITQLWQSEDIGAKKVIAGISGINCLYRLITLPELPKNLLPEAVKREAERALGVSLEEVHLSWQTLPSLRGETLVYLVASPKNAVDALTSTLRKAGLTPYLMDLKPLALARTITQPRAILIDVQPSSFDIVVMSEAIPQVVRSLALHAEASWERKMSVIREELDRAITFYNSSHMDKPIQASVPLLACGELAEHEDTWRLLTGRQERPVQVLPSPMESPEGFPSSQYMANIGLALKEMLGSEKGAIAYSLVNLNVLPEAYIPKARPLAEVVFRPILIGGIVLIALGAFFAITTARQNAVLRSDLAAINQMMVSQHVTAQDVANLRGQVSSVEGTRDAFKTTLGNFRTARDTMNADLSEINSAFASGAVTLSSVSYSGGSIRISGTGNSENAVFNCAKELRASGRFSLVLINSINDGGGFSMTLVK